MNISGAKLGAERVAGNKTDSVSGMISAIRKAEHLEAIGAWRRAAHQWLIAYDNCFDPLMREKICRHRDTCARRLKMLGEIRGRMGG